MGRPVGFTLIMEALYMNRSCCPITSKFMRLNSPRQAKTPELKSRVEKERFKVVAWKPMRFSRFIQIHDLLT